MTAAKITSICVYCGSSKGARDVYVQAAETFGRSLAEKNVTLIYGGGGVGLMGVVADAVLTAGGRAVGVIPQLLMDKEVAHTGLTELHVVPDMHVRKRKMADLADAFVAMPGGAGTLEELFEVYTWAQLGYHNKPIGLLNTYGFYDSLLAMLKHTIDEGFMRPALRDLLMVEPDAAALITRLEAHRPTAVDKWETARKAV